MTKNDSKKVLPKSLTATKSDKPFLDLCRKTKARAVPPKRFLQKKETVKNN